MAMKPPVDYTNSIKPPFPPHQGQLQNVINPLPSFELMFFCSQRLQLQFPSAEPLFSERRGSFDDKSTGENRQQRSNDGSLTPQQQDESSDENLRMQRAVSSLAQFTVLNSQNLTVTLPFSFGLNRVLGGWIRSCRNHRLWRQLLRNRLLIYSPALPFPFLPVPRPGWRDEFHLPLQIVHFSLLFYPHNHLTHNSPLYSPLPILTTFPLPHVHL